MRRLIFPIWLILLLNAFLLAQQPTLTISPQFQANPSDPLPITGQVTMASADTLLYIEYRTLEGGNWSPVDNVDTLNLTFSHSLPTGSLSDGIHEYEFQVTVKDSTGNKTARDTLTIYIDKTPPEASAPSVNSTYFSNTHNSVNFSVSFNEPLSPGSLSFYLKTAADTLPVSNPSLSNGNTEVSFIVTKEMLPAPLSNWEMPIDLWIEQAADTLGNLLQNKVFSGVLTGDFTNPELAGASLSNDTLTTVANSVILSMNFSEPLNSSGGQAIFKTAQQQKSVTMTFSNNNQTASVTITAGMLGSGHDWYGASNFTVSGLTDLAGNPISTVNQPGPFIDILRPYPVQSHYSNNKINIQETSINFWLKFNESIKEANPRLYLFGSTQTMDLSYTLSENNTRLEASFDTSAFVPLADWQGAFYLKISGFVDDLGNPIKADTTLYRFDIDTFQPDAPSLIGYYPLLTVDSTMTVRGRKEKKAAIYYNGQHLSAFRDSTEWKVNLNTSQDSLYYLQFWQTDSLGNLGDTTSLKIMVDREQPTLASIPPTLNLKYDSAYASFYFTLDVYFNESVSIKNKSGFTLHAPEDSIQLETFPFNDHGSYQTIVIQDSSIIKKLQTWYFESDSVWIFIKPNSVEDLATNTNSSPLQKRVVLNSISLIEHAMVTPKFTNAQIDSAADSAFVDVYFRQNSPPELVLKANIQNSLGEILVSANLFLNFNNSPFSFADEKWGKILSTGNRSVRWIFPTDSLAEDTYTIQLFAQTYYMGLTGTPLFKKFIVDRTAPQLESVLPVAADKKHKVGTKPEFRVKLREESGQSPIAFAKLRVPFCYTNTGTLTNYILNLSRDPKSGEFVYNCKAHNLTITPGVQVLTLTIADSAGNQLVKELEYEFVDADIGNISDLYNFPNPFNPKAGEQTTISFAFGGTSPVEIYIFDLSSRLVYYAKQNASRFNGSDLRKYVFWDGKDLNGNPVANGVYFCRIISGSQKSEILKIAVNNH